MMKKYILIFISALMLLTSCEDILERPPVSDLSEETVFNDIQLFREYRDGLYPYLVSGHDNGSSSSLMSISDEGEHMSLTGVTVHKYNDGDFWAGSYEFSNCYSDFYKCIRRSNKILENLENIIDQTDQREVDLMEGEALFFRAYSHFELIKRFGGVPYIKVVIDINDDMNLPRMSYEECVTNIIEDCEQAISLLPIRMVDSQLGRVTRAAAMSLKATTLMFFASPLNNPTNDKQRWQNAAKACSDVINLKDENGKLLFSLMPGNQYLDIFQKEVFEGNTEIIFSKHKDKVGGSNIENNYLTILFSSQWAGSAPTQSIVDYFQMKNGRDISDPASGYLVQDPYKDRDPRFYHDILYNGVKWMPLTLKIDGKDIQTTDIEFWVSEDSKTKGRDIGPEGYSKTGYYFKKHWPYGLRNDRDNQNPGTTAYLPWIYYRLGGMYLYYAEATNEAFGPDADGLGVGLTARGAVNLIRNRVGMPNVLPEYSSNTDLMREQIMKESAVELIGEGHRWYDGIRWKKAKEWFGGSIYGMKITKLPDNSLKHERTLIENRVFTDKHYLYPIPVEQVNMNPNFTQNPGW